MKMLGKPGPAINMIQANFGLSENRAPRKLCSSLELQLDIPFVGPTYVSIWGLKLE